MLTDDRAVLSHVVVDPDAWYAHAVETFGKECADRCLLAKVARWRSEYERESASPDYKTRAEREALALVSTTLSRIG